MDRRTGEAEEAPRITGRALGLGLVTIAATFYFIVRVGQGLGVGSYVHSQLPMAVLMPFVLWLLVTVVVKRVWPAVALRRGELLTIFAMLWVVGTIPQLGWINYWASIVAAPSFFTTSENQWAESFFDYLPWQVFAPTSPRLLETFWLGLPEGESVPWEGWVGVVGQWLGVSMAMVVFGWGLVVVFQRQWVEGEKLAFPLAQMPLDLTRGLDGSGRMPELFRANTFWVGFGVVFVPILYNIGTYFAPGLPPVELYWKHYFLQLGDHFPQVWFRVMPLVMALTYLCPVDILGTLVVFHLLAVVKEGLMRRVGFTVGSTGQPLDAREILYLESYGALVFIALWSIWLARGHLRGVWRQVRTGAGEPGEAQRYRLALLGMGVSAVYVVSWAVSLGMSLGLALGGFALMGLSYFVTAKLIAATGFSYLLPDKLYLSGESFVVDLVGSAQLSVRSLVAFKIFTSNAFFGTFRIPAWPALPHVLRIFSLKAQPGWVTAAVLLAFPVGFVVAAGAIVELAYENGGNLYLGGKANWIFDGIVHLLDNPRHPDLGKWGVWLWGFFEAAGIALLRGHFHWFPFHPIGVAFQYTFGTFLYWFSLLLVWLAKALLLRYGGVRAFRAGKPFFYGLGMGYVTGVMLSIGIDLIWFPSGGHHVHGW